MPIDVTGGFGRRGAWTGVGIVVVSAVAVLLVFTLGGGSQQAAAGWPQVNPNTKIVDTEGRPIDLYDCQMVKQDLIFAVGSGGSIVRSTDFGASWQLLNSNRSHDLLGVSFINENEGVVVGRSQTILRTSDGGESWHLRRPSVDHPQRLDLHAVAHRSQSEVFAVGSGGTSSRLMYQSVDGGETWTDLSEPSTRTLKEVCFSSQAYGIAAGGIFTVRTHPSPGRVMMTCPPGSSAWTAADLHRDVWWGPPLNAVDFLNSTVAYGVSSKDFFLKTGDKGASWTLEARPYDTCQAHMYWDIKFPSNSVGYIVGDYGLVLRSRDAAAHWSKKETQTRVSLRAASFLSPDMGIVVGDGFTALTTADGGATWTGPASPTTRTLHAVDFADADTGMAVGERGDVLKTSDGGLNWTSVWAGNIFFHYHDVDMVDANTAFMAGYCLYRTTDGGQTGVSVAPANMCGFRAVSFLDSQKGIAANAAKIISTDNGGDDWTERYTSSNDKWLRDAHFVSASLAVVVGTNNTILRSTDAGASWTAAQNLGLGGSGPVNLLGVHMFDENKGCAVGWRPHPTSPDNEKASREGVILATSDGGRTWQRRASGTTVPLRAVHFSSEQIGTVVGGVFTGARVGDQSEEGIILRTTDGGQSWSEQSLEGSSGKRATLHGVRFLDGNTGIVVGSNGLIMRTTTGGVPSP